MYLSMLIDYVRDGDRVPRSAHDLFARFVDKKLGEAEYMLRAEYKVSPERLREFAELISFLIIADATLGLNPKRTHLLAVARTIQNISDDGDPMLDALEFLKFARGESDVGSHDTRRFTFSHRRFQEYFATNYVTRVPGAVPDEELLFEPEWRETAAVMLGSSAGAKLDPLLELLKQELRKALNKIKTSNVGGPLPSSEEDVAQRWPDFFPWPLHSLQILSLIQDGFAENVARLPIELRRLVTELVEAAFAHGRLEDRRIALEVSGPICEDVLSRLLRVAIGFGSALLDDVAFRQIRALSLLPEDLSTWIRLTLLQRAGYWQLSRQRPVIFAFLKRVDDDGRLLSSAKLLAYVGHIDWALHVTCLLGVLLLGVVSRSHAVFLTACVIVSIGLRWYYLYIYSKNVANANTEQLSRFRSSRSRFLFPWLPRTGHDARIQAAGTSIVLLLLSRWYLPVMNLWLSAWFSRFETVLFLVLGGWAPMALAASASGEFTSPVIWPALTFFPLMQLLSKPIRTVRTLAHHLAGYGLIYGLLPGLMLYGLSQPIPTTGWLITPYPSFFVTGVVFFLGALFAYWWIADRWRFQQIVNSGDALAPLDFLHELVSYRFESFRVRSIRLVAGRQSLPNTPDSLNIIRHLALVIERELNGRVQGENSENVGLPIFDEWKRLYFERRSEWWRHVLGLSG